MVSLRRNNQPPPPEYDNVESDDESIPPPPPPPDGSKPHVSYDNEDTFEDHERDPLAPDGDNDNDKAPVKKWRLLKKEAEHVLIPQDDYDHDDDDEYMNGSSRDGNGGATAPNRHVPMQGHFRGIQNAQDFDEEEAGMDEIEVPSSSVVARLNNHEQRSVRRSKFQKYAIALVVCVCALVAICVGSVVGTRNRRDKQLASAEDGSGSGSGGNGSGNGNADRSPNYRDWSPTTPAGRYIQESLPEGTTNSMNDANSPASQALDWIENDPANKEYGFGEDGAFDDPATRKTFEQRFTAASLSKALSGGSDEPWGESDGWMSEKDVCEWHGITCGDGRRKLEDGVEAEAGTGTGTITSIVLNGNNLRGSLPPEIGILTDLTTLALVGNWISGPIPSELYDLTNLEALDLYDNVLTGKISSDIAKLTNMGGLYLGRNKLSGPIPAEMGTMENLQELWLDVNELTGDVPASLANCEYLADLRLNDNQLFGPIPPEYGTSSLTLLYLGNNELTGGVPDSFTDSDISTLSLSGNIALFADDFDEGGEGEVNIPLVLYAMPNLERLELSNCGLNGELPGLDLDADWVSLRLLDISDNMIEGQIPRSYGGLENLRVLRMSNNNLEGNLPGSFQNLGNLLELDLSKNILEGPIPAEWGDGMASLQNLSLSANYLTGGIPLELRRWQEIKVLKFDNNILTGELPFWIGRKQTLEEIHFEWNSYDGAPGFSGPIPENFGNLEKLKILNLQGNSFTGAIPDLPSNAVEIRLNDNNLEGNIPESVSGMGSLESFDFQNNPDIQSVPNIICELTSGNLEVLLGGCNIDCACCTDQC